MPFPPVTAGVPTTLQLGQWNVLTDGFVAHPSSPTGTIINLNDGVNFSLVDTGNGLGEGFDWGVPDPDVYTSTNPRVPGERVVRRNYGKRREIRVRLLWGQATSYAAWVTAAKNLMATLEGITPDQPAALQIQIVQSSTPYYADVLEAHPAVMYQETLFNQLLSDSLEIIFLCKPFLRGPRQYLQNLAVNPGFTVGSGPGVQVFAETWQSANAYAVTAGSAPTLNPANTYVDIVQANVSSLLRYYRLGEASGTTSYDIGGTAQNGTTHNAPTQGATGLVSGDTDTAYTFNGTSQYVSLPTTGLPTGTGAWTLLCLCKPTNSTNTNNGHLITIGNPGTTAQAAFIAQNSSGGWNIGTWGGTNHDYTGNGSSTGGHVYLVAGTFDGTHLNLYVGDITAGNTNTTLYGPFTPNTPNLTENTCTLGAASSSQFFFAGTLDEAVVGGAALGKTAIDTIYTAAKSGATGTVANSLSLASGSQVSFGSPSWGAINQWTMRFRWVAGLTATWYVHYTNSTNYLAASLSSTTLQIVQVIAGVSHTVVTTSVTPVHEAWYWAQMTQFPGASGQRPVVQIVLLSDSDGVIGTQISSQQAATFDNATALSGAPQIAANGAPLAFGGATTATNGHTVSLFGPGGWLFPAAAGTNTPASGGWELNTANTYPGGPITGFGAARIDVPPAGTYDAQWHLSTGGSSIGNPASSWAIPVSQSQTLSISVWVKSSGLSGTASTFLKVVEYNASGTSLGSATPVSKGGNIASWFNLTATYTTQFAGCAFVDVQLRSSDATAGASANGTIWFDNVLIYNQTTTGMTSMPYCELRFPQSPAQLLVSGIQGQIPAPMLAAIGTFYATFGVPQTAYFYMGRRAITTPGMRLAQPSTGNGLNFLDSTALGGYTVGANIGPLFYSSQMEVGTYFMLGRAQTANSTPSGVWIAPDIPLNVTAGPGAQPSVSDFCVAEWQGMNVYPFTAQNTWTLVNAGQAILPPFSLSPYTDPTQVYAYASTFSGASSGGSQLTVGYIALLPVDGECFLASITNPSNSGSYTVLWLYMYWDGLGYATSYSLEGLPLPVVSHSAPSTGNLLVNLAPMTINSTGDSTPTLDPSQKTNNPSGLGVNQFLVVSADATATPLPIVVDMEYSPLYLYPL